MTHSLPHPRGFALIMVLVVVALLALSTYTFCSLMITEDESTILYGRQLQTRMLVDSGAAQVGYLLELDQANRQSLGGLYDNPQAFQAQLVVNHASPQGRARFGVVAPRLDEQGLLGGLRFGLQDESSRLNLNALNLEETASSALASAASAAATGGATTGGATTGGATTGGATTGGATTGGVTTGGVTTGGATTGGATTGGATTGGATTGGATTGGASTAGGAAVTPPDTSGRTLLMKLPGMTIDIADAILDWIDPDDEPREYGAEVDYYSSMMPPYTPQNGPLKTIEELLLVRGVTPDLLFGRDINRNGMIDVMEMQLPLALEYDDGTGSMDLGWSAYLTLYSQEKNVSRTGVARIDVNGTDMQQLYDDLSAVLDANWATYIVAYRQSGPFTGTGNTNNEQPAGGQTLDLTQQGRFPIAQLLDLIGTKVQATLANNGGTVVITSPFENNPGAMVSYLPKLMDACTVNAAKTIPGRVNINRAPRLVLLAIPGMTEQIVDGILSQRNLDNSEFQEDLQHETWLMSRALVTLDEMRVLLPFVTARGDVYRAQIVGYFDQGELASRAEVIFDATQPLPRILSWKDLSHLGRGYARETLGVELTENAVVP